MTRTMQRIDTQIDSIDLSKVELKLVQCEKKAIAWVKRAVALYRQFLKLHARYPRKILSPSKAVDEVWHGHILDTKKYPKDCELVFGKYLHHDPYFGTTPAGARKLEVVFKETNRLFKKEFGSTPSKENNFGHKFNPATDDPSLEPFDFQLAGKSCTTDCR